MDGHTHRNQLEIDSLIRGNHCERLRLRLWEALASFHLYYCGIQYSALAARVLAKTRIRIG